MTDERIYSVREQIEDTSATKPHVVILGAGASRAACPDGDRDGRRLPLMDDLIDVLDLRPLLQVHAIDVGDTNFEVLYSQLYPDESKSDLCK